MISLMGQTSIALPLMLLAFGALFTIYDRWRRLKSGYYDKPRSAEVSADARVEAAGTPVTSSYPSSRRTRFSGGGASAPHDPVFQAPVMAYPGPPAVAAFARPGDNDRSLLEQAIKRNIEGQREDRERIEKLVEEILTVVRSAKEDERAERS